MQMLIVGTLAVDGSVTGVALSFVVLRVLGGKSFGVKNYDPLTLTPVPLLLAAVAAGAISCLGHESPASIPHRRFARNRDHRQASSRPSRHKPKQARAGCSIYSRMVICSEMPRAATNSDAFNAVAEPRRREILNYLALQERSVGDIVSGLRLEQPSVSKHLRVLRDVGLVRVRRHGRHMFYRTNADAIRPLYEWSKTFERFWTHQLARIKERAEAKAKEKQTQ
jgi:DNA-binding transcriptional ArsR family regulator